MVPPSERDVESSLLTKWHPPAANQRAQPVSGKSSKLLLAKRTHSGTHETKQPEATRISRLFQFVSSCSAVSHNFK